MGKGLVIVHDPHNLYQFVWYYCSKDNDHNKEWDALCFPNGYKGEYMHTYCEMVGVFSHVYRDDTDFSALPVAKKIKIFIKMILYFICGQRTRYCRKLLGQYVNIDDYDELVVICDTGIITGACIALGKEKKVIILEDGGADYFTRHRFMKKAQLSSTYSWQGFFLALMGYASPNRFKLSTNRNCIKYCSQPSKMKYQDYQELRQLYDVTTGNTALFGNLVEKMYPFIASINFDEVNTILFTRPLKDYVNDYKKYTDRLVKYIQKHYNNVLIKKHPREEENYDFGEQVKVAEVDNFIPAEAILPYIAGKELLIVSTSSIVLYAKRYNIKCKIIDFEGMYEESIYNNSMFTPLSTTALREYCEEYAKGNYEIIKI